MGCKFSSRFLIDPTLPGHDELSIAIYRTLQLTDKDTTLLWREFSSIESRGLGIEVEIRELLNYLGPKSNNEITLKIFRKFAITHCDKLNLCEFICATWSFLSLQSDQLPAFCFMIFDHSDTMQLKWESIMRMASLLHDAAEVKGEDQQRQTLADALEKGHVSELTLSQFEKYSSEHPLLCDPIQKLQQLYRAQVIGSYFWKDVSHKRNGNPGMNGAYYTKHLESLIR